MTKLATRSVKPSAVIHFEDDIENGVCREVVTVTKETNMDLGSVVRRSLPSGTGTYTADSGNTGNFTSSAVTVGTAAMVGNWRVVFTSATTFNVYDPKGVMKTTGATGTAVNVKASGGIAFTLTAGGTAAVAGDSATIAVTGAYVYKWVAAADVAGIVDDLCVVIGMDSADFATVANGDVTVYVLARGDCSVVKESLLYKDTLSAAQKTIILDILKRKRIFNATRV